MEPFEVGSLWEHKLQGFRVFIRAVYEDDGQAFFFLGKIPDKAKGESPFEQCLMDFVIVKHPWTAEELIQNYRPLFRRTRLTVWDHLNDGPLDDIEAK